MPQEFESGDFLVFQLEAGFGLLRVLGSEGEDGNKVWHLAAYRDLFLDVDSAEDAANNKQLTIELPHIALTNRAFESTQVAKITNAPLDNTLGVRIADDSVPVHNRSIRLLLGLR